MTADQARAEAQKHLTATSVETAQCTEPSIITLSDVLERFLEVRKLRPNTIKSYSQVTKRCLKEWLDMPVTAITKHMIQVKHRELTKPSRQGTSGEVQANMAMRILKTLLNFAANNYESADGHPLITINLVKRLSQNRSWHLQQRRRVIIPDHKLGGWYRAAVALSSKTVRDYLLFLLLTGLRRNEAATLRWTDVDFASKTITVRSEIAKNKCQHCLPLTDFLIVLLSQRKRENEYVFPGRSGKKHIVDVTDTVAHVIKNSGCSFVLHDCRRTFITMAAKLGLPHHIIKKLINHIATTDATDGYIVLHVEHLREPMTQINNRFLTLFGCTISDWQQVDLPDGENRSIS
jgi:integrase